MPTTRKKQIKTVYKDEESEGETGDFSDSGSDAKITEASSSEDEDIEDDKSSEDDFKANKRRKEVNKPPIRRRKPKFAKDLINKINKQATGVVDEDDELPTSQFSVKDLTDADKLLPSFLNLSESDSSDEETQTQSTKKPTSLLSIHEHHSDSDNDKNEYHDIWSSNIHDNSEVIAKKTFLELEKHKTEIEQTKASVDNYVSKNQDQTVTRNSAEFNVNDLLAQGEEVIENKLPPKIMKKAKHRKDSDSDVEDWEEVNEAKAIPQQGLQLFVEFPNANKKKKLDLEMMMRRKINRVKKEYQVYMHKVHVLCWLGHGNYVSRVLNDQEVMAAALAMVPKGCYPEERLTTKYVEQITTWYKDKLRLKQDKNEHKFRPKAPPLKNTILSQIKSRVTTAKKYNVFIFVAMLRALGLQCRVMFNFVTLPIRPPTSELCSLSTKQKGDIKTTEDNPDKKSDDKNSEKNKPKAAKPKAKCTKNIAQVDGTYDTLSESDSEFEDIIQLDGGNEVQPRTRSTRSTRGKKLEASNNKDDNDGVSPPKRARVKSNIDEDADKDKSKITKDVSTTSDDKPPEAPKSPLNRKSVRNKNTTNIESQDTSSKHIKTEKQSNSVPNRAARNKNGMKGEDTNIKKETLPKEKPIKLLVEDKETKESIVSQRRSVRNKENTSKKDADAKRKPSKSPQPKTSNKASESNSNNIIVKDSTPPKTLSPKILKANKDSTTSDVEMLSPRKTRANRRTLAISEKKIENNAKLNTVSKAPIIKVTVTDKPNISAIKNNQESSTTAKAVEILSPRKTRAERRISTINDKKIETAKLNAKETTTKAPTITVTDEHNTSVESEFFTENKGGRKINLSRKRSHTAVNNDQKPNEKSTVKAKARTKSAPGTSVEKSKYFDDGESVTKKPKVVKQSKKVELQENKLRVSHRDLKQKTKPKNDVTEDLVDIIKNRIKVEKAESKKGIVKGKVKKDSDDDSDFLPVEDVKSHDGSDDDFKPIKISPRPKVPRPSTSKKIDRRVLSSDDDVVKQHKLDVWCEVFVEELEQWIAVDAIKGKVHCSNELYTQATHPICYIVGWDNNNYLKDLTRRYVPHWNTVTRKQRAEPTWWKTALEPWLGPKTARDREEDEYLDRMQLEAPLPKSIAEYKNHPLYALKRHILKYEAIYPPDVATLGFVRGEAVYPRDCVYICQSRDKWLKEAKVVRLGEKPYKIVKARPRWDRLSNKCITDKPLEIFGPWQVQEYEPPTAENGIVPRNAYGNVELFKDSMLPKKTVLIKLPGLNKVAKKLNIDCAPAMTGFDFNGGYSHPIYDGFVVCEEFADIITEAWVVDQEDRERKEREKVEARVYGNWRHLIRALMIRERLKLKYGFEEPSTSQEKPKSKGPRLVVKKK